MKIINFDAFVVDINLDEVTGDNLDDMLEALKTKVSVSRHFMHVTTKQITIYTSNPWYTEELREQKKKVRRENLA